MTMLISKFNKMIQSRLIWITLSILIVLAFVVWGTSVPRSREDAANRQAAGFLYGKPVSGDILQQAKMHTYLTFTLATGQQIPRGPEQEAAITQLAWRRIISLKEAERLGIHTDASEIVAQIQRDPSFQQDGQYHPEIYHSFLQQFLIPMGFSPQQFEEHMRQEITLQKLQRVVGATALITPAEVDLAVHILGDEFTAEYVLVDAASPGDGLTLTDEEVRAFFERDPAAFTLPTKVRVKFVRFPVAEFMDRLTVTEQQARDYYDLHTEDFTYYTDPKDKEDGEDGEDAPFPVAELKPFEDVQDEIIENLRRQEARRAAADEAMDFVVQLVPDQQGEAKSFEDAAADLNRPVEVSGFFAQNDPLAGYGAGTRFTRAAFQLRPNPYDYFSDVIEGDEFAYVLAFDEKQDPRVPTFEEVKDVARVAALEDATAQAISDLADTFYAAAKAGLANGSSFAKVAEDLALIPHGPVTFTVSTGLDDIPEGEDLLRSLLTHNEGEVTEPQETERGYLIAYLSKRVPAEPSQFAMLRGPIIDSLTRERGQILFNQWQEQWLRDAEFKPREIEQPAPERDENYEDYDADYNDEF